MNHVRTNSGKAWLLAARPKTLTGAITPVLVGCALAYSDGQLQWTPAVLCLLFACLMQVAANFINELLICWLHAIVLHWPLLKKKG